MTARRTPLGVAICAIGIIVTPMLHAQRGDRYKAAREAMVANFVQAAGVKNPRVLDSLRNTPRHEFVTANLRPQAYFDMALPIGDKQTISSPFIVAYMTESLEPQPDDRVLEIGTGSGFQAAVLSPLVKEVYSIEIVPKLGRTARRTLKRLRYRNVFTKIGDGFQGWEEHAPFDKIIVTCSPEKVPTPLARQLKEGGLMVIPVGERYQQTLYLLRKTNGRLESVALRPTLFVPMTGRAENIRQIKPDPKNPRVVNGTFEEPVAKNGFVPGWYYQRQLSWETDEKAPEGQHVVVIRNKISGRASHLIQGMPIDGAAISQIELSAYVRHENVQDADDGSFASIAITFYDDNRKDLANRYLARFRGDSDWTRESRRIPVPKAAREAILRIGLFGATGEIAFDQVQLRVVE